MAEDFPGAAHGEADGTAVYGGREPAAGDDGGEEGGAEDGSAEGGEVGCGCGVASSSTDGGVGLVPLTVMGREDGAYGDRSPISSSQAAVG